GPAFDPPPPPGGGRPPPPPGGGGGEGRPARGGGGGGGGRGQVRGGGGPPHPNTPPPPPPPPATPKTGGPGAARASGSGGGEMMERQVQHMARMVDALLDVSRITRGKIELRKEAVDMAPVVERTVEATRPLIEDRQQTLTVDLPPEPVRLEADPTRLEQVLANLLNNAAKYTDHGVRSGCPPGRRAASWSCG